MFDTRDADYQVASEMYRRCAYEALLAMRQDKPAEQISKWVNLSESIANLWRDCDVIIVEDLPNTTTTKARSVPVGAIPSN